MGNVDPGLDATTNCSHKQMGSRHPSTVLPTWLETMLAGGAHRRGREGVGGEATEVAGAHRWPEATARQGVSALVTSDLVSWLPTDPLAAISLVTPALRITPPRGMRSLSARLGWRRRDLALVLAALLVPAFLIAVILQAIWTRTPHVPFWDEWETVYLVQHYMQGTLSLGQFLAFHNENRIVIPRLIDLALILPTHWNRQVEMTFDLVVALAEATLFAGALARKLRSAPFLAFLIVPLSMLLFSFAQYEDWLAPFQITFTATVFGAACCVFVLSRETVGWRTLVVAIAGATVAALSSVGGTLAFAAFLPAVMRGGYRKTAVWIACGLGVLAPYFQGFPHGVPISLSLPAVEYFLAWLGAPLSAPYLPGSIFAGAVSLVLAAANFVVYMRKPHRMRGIEAWMSLGLLALGIAAVTTEGRLPVFGVTEAPSSRYMAFSCLWWIALIAVIAINVEEALQAGRVAPIDRAQRKPTSLVPVHVAVLLLVTLTLIPVNIVALRPLETWQLRLLQKEVCVVNYQYAPPPCLLLFVPIASAARAATPFLEQAHLGIFASHVVKVAPPKPLTETLTSYLDLTTGDDWVTTSDKVNMSKGYIAPVTYGYVYAAEQPGTHPIFDCFTGRDHFLSLHADCEGQKVLALAGWLYDSPPASLDTRALYRCFNGTHHLLALYTSCRGQHFEGLLGYIPTRPPGGAVLPVGLAGGGASAGTYAPGLASRILNRSQ